MMSNRFTNPLCRVFNYRVKHPKIQIFLFFSLCLNGMSYGQSSLFVCSGSSVSITATNSGQLSNTSYSLNPGGQTNSTGIFAVSPTVSTSYTCFVTGQNAQNNLVTNTEVFDISVMPLPTITYSVVPPVCGSNKAYVTSTLSAGQYTLAWDNTPPKELFLTTGMNVSNISPLVYNGTITSGACMSTVNITIPPVVGIQDFTVNSMTSSIAFSVDCRTPTLALQASPANLSYTWFPQSSPSNSFTGSSLNLNASSQGGFWIIQSKDVVSGCSQSKIMAITVNFAAPNSIIHPTLQTITCSLSSVNNISVTINNSSNYSQEFWSPNGALYTTPSYSALYAPVGPGIYTHCAVNADNGCKTNKTFTVLSSWAFPTYSFQSQNNYTLGCSSKSVDVINVLNPQIGGSGQLSYTLIPPFSSTVLPSGPLNSNTSFTTNSPGMHVLVVRDHVSACEVRTPFTIKQLSYPASFYIEQSDYYLTCNVKQLTLNVVSNQSPLTYSWTQLFPNTSSSQNASVIVNTNGQVTNSIAATFSVEVTNQSSLCKSNNLVTVYQNLFSPAAAVSGPSLYTCTSSTIVLNNQSSSTVPPSSFPVSLIEGAQWIPPFPQQVKFNSQSYIANAPGSYTLTARSSSNGCMSSTVYTVVDKRVYPNAIFAQSSPLLLPCPGVVQIDLIVLNLTPPNYSVLWSGPPTGTTTSNTNPGFFGVTGPGTYSATVTNLTNSCTTTATIELWACVGVETNEAGELLTIYPNPTHHELNLKPNALGRNLYYELYNSLGSILIPRTGIGENEQIDLDDYQSGIYYLKIIEDGNQLKVLKVVKD